MRKYLILLVYAILQSFNVLAHSHMDISKGLLDLRKDGLPENGVFYLGGEWEFYWMEFLVPGVNIESNAFYGKIPSYWTEYNPDGKKLPREGYATYRLRVLLPPGFREKLAVNVPVFDSSFKIFINGVMAGENGRVGKSMESSEADYKPFIVMFNPLSDTVEIMVQVSNFQHRRGGFWKQMRFGLAESVQKQHQQYVFISNLSMGILMAFSAFFLFFFLFYRKDLVPFYFSVFLGGILIRLLSTGIYPITLITDISWDWMVRLEYLGTYISAIGGTWFFHSLYPLRIMKFVTICNSIILFLFCCLILILPVSQFAYTMIYFQYVVIIYLIVYLPYSFISIFKKDRLNLVYFTAFLIFFLALLNDILLSASRPAITIDYTIHIAVQIFIFIHAVMLIRTWIKAFIEKEKLNLEIAFLNQNLESLVSQRTIELEKSNIEVNVQNDKIAIQNERLKEEIVFKNRVFSIIAHDLKSPVTSLLLFFEVIKRDPGKIQVNETLSSIHGLALSFNDLIDNLLYWGRSQGKQIQLNPGNCDLDETGNRVIDLFTEGAKLKSIQLHYTKGLYTRSYCDPELIQIVIRNLVSNALKFTQPGGEVRLSIGLSAAEGNMTEIVVSDNGLGIPPEKLNSIRNGEIIESTFGTSREKGTGLGLSLCFELVNLMQGKMEIVSTTGQGTRITVKIPGPAS